MDATARVVRIYYSASQYRSDEQPSPIADPLEATDFPTAGDRLRVWFGPIPPRIAGDLQTLVALANVRLNLLVGQPVKNDDDGIRAELAKVKAEDQLSLDQLWYATFAVDRPIVLPDEDLTGEEIEWPN